MRKLNVVLVVMMLTFSSVLMAEVLPPKMMVESTITKEIGKLLKAPFFEVGNVVMANVVFTVNKNNEIVVLSVESNDTRVNDFIKSRLNYKKLDAVLSPDVKEYTVPIRIEPNKNL